MKWGLWGGRAQKKGMYDLFPFLWPFICYFSLNLSVLEVFGRFLCAVNDGLRLACCLRNGIANTGPRVELAKRQNGPNCLYIISGHKVATLGNKKYLCFSPPTKILGNKSICPLHPNSEGGSIGLYPAPSMQAEAHVWKFLLHDTPPKPPNRFASWSPSFGVVSPP